jgi:hypothetical protein
VFARIHTLETTPEQHAQGLQLVRDQLLPWARDSSGFRGLIGLTDAGRGVTLVVTLWADAGTLASSADAADNLSVLAAEAVGATRLSLDSYEISLYEVPS